MINFKGSCLRIGCFDFLFLLFGVENLLSWIYILKKSNYFHRDDWNSRLR